MKPNKKNKIPLHIIAQGVILNWMERERCRCFFVVYFYFSFFWPIVGFDSITSLSSEYVDRTIVIFRQGMPYTGYKSHWCSSWSNAWWNTVMNLKQEFLSYTAKKKLWKNISWKCFFLIVDFPWITAQYNLSITIKFPLYSSHLWSGHDWHHYSTRIG